MRREPRSRTCSSASPTRRRSARTSSEPARATCRPRSSSRSRRKKAKAKASWSGDYATFYQHYNGYGAASFNINSGYQEPDLGRVGCFLWFCNNYNNMISSVRTHGTSAVLYDYEGLYGDVYVVGPNQLNNIPARSNDRASSGRTTPGAGNSAVPSSPARAFAPGPPRARLRLLAIWIRLPHVSSSTAVVTGPSRPAAG